MEHKCSGDKILYGRCLECGEIVDEGAQLPAGAGVAVPPELGRLGWPWDDPSTPAGQAVLAGLIQPGEPMTPPAGADEAEVLGNLLARLDKRLTDVESFASTGRFDQLVARVAGLEQAVAEQAPGFASLVSRVDYLEASVLALQPEPEHAPGQDAPEAAPTSEGVQVEGPPDRPTEGNQAAGES